tara:strand:+ start:1450 stop:1689 length:240 start_codon:yes stop_codon:yes gene_type:complete
MNSKEMYEAHNVVENSQFDKCCNCGEHSPIMHESEKWCGDICFVCYVKEELLRKEKKIEDEKFDKMMKEKYPNNIQEKE